MKTEKENIEPFLHKTIDGRRKMLHILIDTFHFCTHAILLFKKNVSNIKSVKNNFARLIVHTMIQAKREKKNQSLPRDMCRIF